MDAKQIKEKSDKLDELIISLQSNMKKLPIEEQVSLQKLFILRAVLFESIISGYMEPDDKRREPVEVLKQMGYLGLGAVDMYRQLVNPKAEEILRRGMTDEQK